MSNRDDIALQIMLAMARETALTPQAMAQRTYALADAIAAERDTPVQNPVRELARLSVSPSSVAKAPGEIPF